MDHRVQFVWYSSREHHRRSNIVRHIPGRPRRGQVHLAGYGQPFLQRPLFIHQHEAGEMRDEAFPDGQFAGCGFGQGR